MSAFSPLPGDERMLYMFPRAHRPPAASAAISAPFSGAFVVVFRKQPRQSLQSAANSSTTASGENGGRASRDRAAWPDFLRNIVSMSASEIPSCFIAAIAVSRELVPTRRGVWHLVYGPDAAPPGGIAVGGRDAQGRHHATLQRLAGARRGGCGEVRDRRRGGEGSRLCHTRAPSTKAASSSPACP